MSAANIFSGHVLTNHAVAVYHVKSEMACGLKCLQHDTCLSYNYKPVSDKQKSSCKLNDANRIACPLCFVIERDTTYFEDIKVLKIKKKEISASKQVLKNWAINIIFEKKFVL